MADTTTITYESRFCRQCDNLMHILTDDDGASRYKCRTCQGTSDMTGVDRVVVLRREYNRSTTRDELSDQRARTRQLRCERDHAHMCLVFTVCQAQLLIGAALERWRRRQD